MNLYLPVEEIIDRCRKLGETYEIDEEKFYQIVEKWADKEVSIDDKIVNSYKELLQMVSDEMREMESAVDLTATCRMGCAFCCYFPIIINGMEAKIIKKAVEQFPQERRNQIKDHLKAYYERYSDQIEQITNIDFHNDQDFKLAYRKQFLPCPLLDTKRNQCMAYEIRPIPCRTYVNYTDPTVCEENLMPSETVSFEFLYEQYMGALNEFMQFLYEEGDTAFIDYPDDAYQTDYLVNWLRHS